MNIVIGMGGGYDIVAAYMVAKHLERQSDERKNFHIGGFLNPKFMHYFYDEKGIRCEQKAINRVYRAQKFRMNLYGAIGNEVYFVDSSLANCINKPVIDFSTESLTEVCNYLNSNYSEIVFCDVGGDVLYAGKSDNTVKTPVLDAFALKIAGILDKKKKNKVRVLVLGVGFDGELPFQNIKKNLACLEKNKGVLGEWMLEDEDISVLEGIYQSVKKSGKGKTLELIIDVWHGNEKENKTYFDRRIFEYKEWFNRCIYLSPTCTSEMNPLCSGADYTSMLSLAKNLGVSMERYISKS